MLFTSVKLESLLVTINPLYARTLERLQPDLLQTDCAPPWGGPAGGGAQVRANA